MAVRAVRGARPVLPGCRWGRRVLDLHPEAPVRRDGVGARASVEDGVVRELDAFDNAGGVEDLDVALGLGVVHEPLDLKAPRRHELALVGPDRRRIVDRIVLAGDLEQQLEPNRASAKALGEFLAEVVTAPLTRLVVRDRRLTRGGSPAIPDPGSLALGAHQPEAVRRAVGELGEAGG